jgi:hypothetical protein
VTTAPTRDRGRRNQTADIGYHHHRISTAFTPFRLDSNMVARARAVPIECEIERRGIKLRGRIDRCGPCPCCGGTDRFSINIKKQCWNCRRCNRGGDVIAAWLWSKRKPIKGSPAETYLRIARGITFTLPATIGFLPASKPEHHPAMISAFGTANEREPGILSAPEKVVAVHLTLLKPDGKGKAAIEPNKITIGSPAGMPIMLAPMNEMMGLAITEGIEDARSVHLATGLGAWAAGSAPFLPKVVSAVEDLATTQEFDGSPDSVTVFIDDDDTGRRHGRALASALVKLSAELAATAGSEAHFDVLIREARP